MMVMEKYRDIAVLMSMGARRAQIRRIFMLQGVLIGVVGSAIGLAAGYASGHSPIAAAGCGSTKPSTPLAFVPFEPRPLDALWIAAAAVLVSFVATIYPARSATQNRAHGSVAVRISESRRSDCGFNARNKWVGNPARGLAVPAGPAAWKGGCSHEWRHEWLPHKVAHIRLSAPASSLPSGRAATWWARPGARLAREHRLQLLLPPGGTWP